MTSIIRIQPEVREALETGAPVVALESTLIAHGLPRPDNLQLAKETEEIVRREGVIPATIGIINGTPVIGLNEEELEQMATTEGIPKLSVRDLPMACAKKSHGATTVASTAYLAAQAGIRIFATGGLGGVHREARESWDVSADLYTLSRTPVAVVCAGVKSILDIPATLEVLETYNVPVVGYRTSRFPGFYLTDSGYPLDWQAGNEIEAARMIHTCLELGLKNTGMVIANPIPAGEQLDPALHDRVLKWGLKQLKIRRIRGKQVTPFLLDFFKRETGGESLRVNKQIIRNNACLAARIAKAYARLQSAGH